MMVFFPSFVMIGLYIHMIVAVNLLAVASAASKAKLRGKMTPDDSNFVPRVNICYTLNRLFLFLAFAGKANLSTTENFFLAFLTFFTNCINPLIYGLSNKKISQSYKNVSSVLF